MLLLFLFTCFSTAYVSGETTNVVQCTNHAGDLPLNTHIVGCVNPPCRLPQLQDTVMNVVFKAPRNLRSMTTYATAYLFFGVPIQYPLGANAITCNFLSNTYCPVLAEEVVQYTLKMFIESIFPVGISVQVEFRVVDENNEPVFCFRTGLTIIPPVTTNNSTLAIDGL